MLPTVATCHAVMRWMEQCAYIAASRVGRGGHLLTGSMDAISFSQPTRVGDVMYITAQVSLLLTLRILQNATVFSITVLY